MMDDNTYNTSFYGMDDFFYKKIGVWKGETDLQVIKDKMKTGKYLLYAVETDDNNFVEENKVLHQPGDKVILTYGNGQKREFEILSLIKSDYYAMTGLFTLVGGVLTMVIGIIGLLNFMNSVLTGMVTRQQEFAMMEAIGMTRKQLSKMLVPEAAFRFSKKESVVERLRRAE